MASRALYTGLVSTTAGIATGTALRTMIQIGSSASRGLAVVEWWIEFNGTTATNAPIPVEVMVGGTALGSPTALTIRTYKDNAGTATATASQNNPGTSTEPGTPGSAIEIHQIPPTSGLIVQYPLGREPEIGASSFFGLRVTAAVTVNATFGIVWEE